MLGILVIILSFQGCITKEILNGTFIGTSTRSTCTSVEDCVKDGAKRDCCLITCTNDKYDTGKQLCGDGRTVLVRVGEFGVGKDSCAVGVDCCPRESECLRRMSGYPGGLEHLEMVKKACNGSDRCNEVMSFEAVNITCEGMTYASDYEQITYDCQTGPPEAVREMTCIPNPEADMVIFTTGKHAGGEHLLGHEIQYDNEVSGNYTTKYDETCTDYNFRCAFVIRKDPKAKHVSKYTVKVRAKSDAQDALSFSPSVSCLMVPLGSPSEPVNGWMIAAIVVIVLLALLGTFLVGYKVHKSRSSKANKLIEVQAKVTNRNDTLEQGNVISRNGQPALVEVQEKVAKQNATPEQGNVISRNGQPALGSSSEVDIEAIIDKAGDPRSIINAMTTEWIEEIEINDRFIIAGCANKLMDAGTVEAIRASQVHSEKVTLLTQHMSRNPKKRLKLLFETLSTCEQDHVVENFKNKYGEQSPSSRVGDEVCYL